MAAAEPGHAVWYSQVSLPGWIWQAPLPGRARPRQPAQGRRQPHNPSSPRPGGVTESCLSLISREGPGLLVWPRRGCISFQRANEPQLLGGGGRKAMSRSLRNGTHPRVPGGETAATPCLGQAALAVPSQTF